MADTTTSGGSKENEQELKPTMAELEAKINGIQSEVEKKVTWTLLKSSNLEYKKEIAKQIENIKNQVEDPFFWNDQLNPDTLWSHLVKGKKLNNPKDNYWNPLKTKAQISEDGLEATGLIQEEWRNVFAEKPFLISANARKEADGFPGTVVQYFEVINIRMPQWFWVGFSSGNDPIDYSNWYAFRGDADYCLISGEQYDFGLSMAREREIKSKLYYGCSANFAGCGILMDPNDEVSIFFTINGYLLGKPIPISPTVDCLFPTVRIPSNFTVMANFGNRPFQFRIDKHTQWDLHELMDEEDEQKDSSIEEEEETESTSNSTDG